MACERAGAVTYQSVQTELNGKPLRLFLIGYELGRPGGPRKLVAGRDIIRSHYEMVVDRSAGLGARPGSASGHARAQIHGCRTDAQTN